MNKLILLALLFINLVSYGQNDSSLPLKDKLSFYGAYSGNNIINPGFLIGTEYPIMDRQVLKEKTKKQKTITHQIQVDGNIGFYWNPFSHCGLYTNFGVSYLKTHTKGFQYKFGLNPFGYYRSFLPETYEIDEDWEVKKVFLPGRSYYAPTVTIGIGKSRPDKKLNSWFFNIKGMLLSPYNGHIMPVAFLEYGYRFKL